MDTNEFEDAITEANRRFLLDARFKARAVVASALAEGEMKKRNGGGVLQRHERRVVEHAAAIALVLQERDLIP